MVKRVTVVKLRRIGSGNINADLQWLGNSLGLFGLRDKDSSCFRIFIILVKKTESPISSDEIAERLHLSHPLLEQHQKYALWTMWGSLMSLPVLWFLFQNYIKVFRAVFIGYLIAVSIGVTLTGDKGGKMVYEYGVGVVQ